MSNLILNGTSTVCGISIPNIEGGFGEGKKAMLVKDIAALHGFENYKVNQDINRNRGRFKDNVDIIDLKGTDFVITLSDNGIMSQNSINRAKNIYALSERGYSKLLKIFDDDLAWERYDQIMDEYFNLRSQASVPVPKDNLEIAAIMIDELRRQRDLATQHETRINQIEHRVETVKEVFVGENGSWRDMIHKNIDAIVDATGNNHYNIWSESYRELDRHGFNIRRRLENRRNRMASLGVSKTERNKIGKLDIIEADSKAREIYSGIVREMVMKYVV